MLATAAALLSVLAATEQPKLQYTTYFYTAGEAVVHGYEPHTKVRVVSLDRKGTIWEGEVGAGDTRTVSTGRGVFGFIADKKATILVGTPTSCTVVGYFVKDETGSFRSKRFFTQLPANANSAEHFVIWAYEPAKVQLTLKGAHEPFKTAELKGGDFLDITGPALRQIAGQVVEVTSDGKGVSAEVYYDEGFMVPADNGRGSGRRFLTYVGTITNGVNDLNVLAQGADASVTVRDLQAKKVLFEGKIARGGIKTLTLKDKFVEVTSDVAVNVVVAAFEHQKAGYAEHHFQTGLEGSGIENDFLVTTPGELWLFSYFSGNDVKVTNATTGETVFSGTLNAGAVRGLNGVGLFRIKGSKGLSVMGGSSSCGADYSPAGSMFAVDEALFEVIAQVKEQRAAEAAAQGKTLSDAQLNAPITATEWKNNASRAPAASPAKSLSLDEVNERAAAIQAH